MSSENQLQSNAPTADSGVDLPGGEVSSLPLLRVTDLKIGFRQARRERKSGASGWEGVHQAVCGMSFEVARNSVVALVGESGSGKSVSALSLMGLLPTHNTVIATDSKAWFEGRDLFQMSEAEKRALRGSQIAMIFQDPMSSLNPVLSIGFQIAEVLRQHKQLSAAAARQRVLALLEEVGIPSPHSRIDSFPGELSGGQQQRVMIAMAIACEPKLLIADEPTTALDVTIQKQIVDLLNRLRKNYQMSMLFITHDLALVAEIADQVVVMRHGEVLERGAVSQIFNQPRHPYTQALLHCRPRLDERPHRLPVIDDYLRASSDEQAGAACASSVLSSTAAEPAGEDEAKQARRGARILRLPATMESALAQLNCAQATTRIVLEARGLSKSFSTRAGLFTREEFRAVDDVSFTLERGKTLGVVGESGSGKSTLGLSLLRLHQASKGQVLFEGRDILAMSEREFSPYKRRLQIIFQNPYASLNPRFTIAQILMEPMRIHAIGENDEARAELARQLLLRVGLPVTALHRHPHEFSGGQRQRIAIARCLTMQPEVLICDESVSALDVSVQAQVLNLLRDLQEEFGLSYIFISHDLAVIKYIADQVMVMRQGRVVEMNDSRTLYAAPAHAYTKSLLAAIPRGLRA
jgi:peptide/nickel transport system ATP-binding protein